MDPVLEVGRDAQARFLTEIAQLERKRERGLHVTASADRRERHLHGSSYEWMRGEVFCGLAGKMNSFRFR